MRLVVDTNVLVSALLFRGAVSRLRTHWTSGRVRLLMSAETETELVRVLCYPKFKLPGTVITALVASEILPFRDRVEVSAGPPVCRDPADDVFLWVARAGQADALVTGDDDLLSLGETWEGVSIRRPAEILVILDGGR